MGKATKEENENQHTEPENHGQPSAETYLDNGQWKPITYPTLNQAGYKIVQKKLEEKTLVGTARTILEQVDK